MEKKQDSGLACFLIVMKLLQLYIRHSFTLYAYLSYLFYLFLPHFRFFF